MLWTAFLLQSRCYRVMMKVAKIECREMKCMEKKWINAQNVGQFAYVNNDVCARPVRGIMISFMGLGGSVMHLNEHPEVGVRWAERGIVYVMPYLNPWNWMNDQAVRMTDDIVAAVLEKVGVDQLPIVSTGGSMGGLCALVYTRYSRHAIAACVANCPVCDLPYHYTERSDLPRTLYSAYGDSMVNGDLVPAMEAHSPLHLARRGDMPRVPYTIFHCEQDKAVNKQRHSDELVPQLKKCAQSVSYYAVPDKGHCDLTAEMWEKFDQAVLNAVCRE